MKIFGKLLFLFFCVSYFSTVCQSRHQSESLKLLVLSGSNNHEWKATSDFLKHMYQKTGLFEIWITENPDTLKEEDLQKFDVIVSNWNSWPENDLRWSKALEVALINFIETGGGFVTFHASTSAFYQWPEFKNISVAAWVDSTWHGENGTVQVIIQNNEHPVTKGLNDFFIFDELWINAEENQSFTILGEATNNDISEKGIKNQPAIFVKKWGKGRIFHTILGHDLKAMDNDGFIQLMLRGTEWAATGKVGK